MARTRLMWCAVAALLLCGMTAGEAGAARMTPLSDLELDAVYAGGLMIQLDFDIAISEGAEIVSNVGWDQVQELLANGVQLRGPVGDGTTVIGGGFFDANGVAALVNPANLLGSEGGVAGGSGWLGPPIDIDVVNGDVAIGMNIVVLVDSVIVDSSIYQFNFNFTDISDILDQLLP